MTVHQFIPLPKKQYLLWVGVLYIVAIVWSIIVSMALSSRIDSAVVLSIPLMIFGATATAFGLNRNAHEHTLIPWYVLAAGFPLFVMHGAFYSVFFSPRALLNRLSNAALFRAFLVWEILGAIYLLAASWAKQERVGTIALCLALYLLIAYGSLVFGFMIMWSILEG